MSTPAFIAVARFGLGAKPGDLDGIARDAKSWVMAQLARPNPMPRALDGLATGQQAAAELTRVVRRGVAAIEQTLRQGARQAYVEEAGLRVRAQVESEQPVHERLVAFWSNHFTVSVQRLLTQCEQEGRALSATVAAPGHAWRVVNSGPAELAGSYSELLSAAGNLISNAVRYTPASGLI